MRCLLARDSYPSQGSLRGGYVESERRLLLRCIGGSGGGIGIAPGANINYKTGHAVFEATHGTAPALADLDKVNPCSFLLSAEMMLRYMGWTEAADRIVAAIEGAITAKVVKADLAEMIPGAEAVSTSAFADALVSRMN